MISFHIKRTNGDVDVLLLPHKDGSGCSFLDLTKCHICPCKFKTIAEAIQDILKHSNILEYSREDADMAIYRSKPHFVQAFKYDGDFKGTDGKYYVPDWAVRALETDHFTYKDAGELYIRGDVVDIHVKVGDYILRNDDGYITKMDAETFESSYVKEFEIKDGSAMDYHM